MAQPLPMRDALSGPPPAAPKGPTFAGMAGGAGAADPNATAMGMSPGLSQISAAAVRMAMEIDQALKVLAQQIPILLPWVEKTTVELRTQLGQALNAGAVPTAAMPHGRDPMAMPDGSGRL